MSHGTEWSEENINSHERSGMDIRAILWERKWILIFFGIVGGTLGYLQFSRKPPIFRSSAQVLVKRNESQLPISSVSYMSYSRDPIDTHVALFHTPVLLENAVEQLQLNELTTLAGSGNPISTISANLHVRRSSSSEDILTLTYTCGNRVDSQRILEAVVSSYLNFLGETQRSTSIKTVELITQAKDDLSEALQIKEEAYQKFRETASLLWDGAKGRNLHQQRLAQIESNRSQVMIQMSQVRAELGSIKQAMEQGVSREALLIMADQSRQRVSSSAVVTQRSITGQLIPLMLDEAVLLETLGANHPQVLEVRTKIDVMTRLLQNEAGESGEGEQINKPRPDFLTIYLQSLQEELRVSNEKVKELDNLFLIEKQASQKLGADENRQRALQEDLERTKGLFSVVIDRLQEISLTKDSYSLSGQIISLPSTGSEVKSEVYTYIFSSGGLGILFGVCIGILLEFGDKRFRSPEEMMQTMRVPILGHIPEMASARHLKILKDDQVAPTVANYHRPQSRIAEAYRLVRTSLLFGATEGKCSIIQFTSPDPGDGKSTLCANVAVAVANSGKRVLIIDSDLRRPTQHKLFGVEHDAGLSSLIVDGGEIQDVIQETVIENLQILPAGPKTHHPSELLHSNELGSILEALRVKYDFIFLDSPPVLAVSDAAALSQVSDKVLIVLKNSRSCVPHAKQTRVSLDLVNANVMGIVVNSVSDETGYRYEAGQYRRGIYGYGYTNTGYYNRAYQGYYEKQPAPRDAGPRFSSKANVSK
ncbi:MAG: polysaccharide biosynthesis tyrosine autokinase [Planctomycetaceae bacterium]|nr:polysaccharide biosynthesis tyrosine autokinase [Planctomycetaceae bacterium]